MSYKDILVYTDPGPWCAARFDLAADLARTHDAHLTALYVDAPPYTPVDIIGTSVGDAVKQWQADLRRSRQAQAKGIVDAARQRSGREIEWHSVEDALESGILLHSCYNDVIVLSQDSNPFNLSEPLEPSVAQVCLGAGRPVVVVPRDNRAKTCGEHVLVAWKATAQAARALHAALPILARARTVTIMEVDAAKSGRIAGADIARHLARHGIKVTVKPMTGSDADAGRVILAQAEQLGADLIVSGAYGHSRLWEMVVGGTTRHLLEHHRIPLFLSN
ncbi:universal stress protein [Ferrovibrio terrae]|uniref:universal stress protein n=1 Tax=Ferrovibrio terrae TaxID=2594003 RepID=UPI0031378D92